MTEQQNKQLALDSRRRARYRVNTDVHTALVFGSRELDGQLLNVSQSGAFIAGNAEDAAIGDGVRLTFQLPTGAELGLCATVRWTRRYETEHGPSGIGVQFYGLGRAEESAIARFVKAAQDSQSPSPVAAHVSKKFSVRCREGALWIRVNGFLDAQESKEFSVRTRREINLLPKGARWLYLDATQFAPCPEDSLLYLREMFCKLGEADLFRGVVVGSGSVAMLQLRRLAREAGIADGLACFNDEAEGLSFWQEICGAATG